MLIVCAAVAAPTALGQPLGSEFHVNSVTSLSQSHPKVARRYGDPGFVVTWDGGGIGFVTTDIYVAVFDATAAKLVEDFRVNSYLTGFQTYPAVAGEYDGTFTVVWESMGQNESNYGVYGQRLGASGSPIGEELLVSTYTTGLQRHPSIAPAASGVRTAFHGEGVGDSYGVYQSSGTFASESLVNAFTGGGQKSAGISGNIGLSAGAPDYLLVWSGNGADDGDQGIYGHVYDTSGSSLGADFRVNLTAAGGQTAPAVAADPFALGYVVVWVSPGVSFTEIFAQRLEANGSPRGGEFRVNTYTTGSQSQPQVAVDDVGNFVVVWSNYVTSNDADVHAQAFSAAGTPIGPEFTVNTYATNKQRLPSVAATGAGGQFVIVWQSFGQEGTDTGEGVVGRLFSMPYANGDANGDGKIDVSDVFYLINYLFAGGTDPVGISDANGDGKLDVADVFYLINFLFAGGDPPV
jgi:hypothetical protein